MYSEKSVTVGHEPIMWEHIHILSLTTAPFDLSESFYWLRNNNKIIHC